MKSLVCTQPRQLMYSDMNAPVQKPGHAIIRIKRVGVCGTDLHAYEGTQPYFSYPRILGHELAGDLVEADNAVDFVPGEAVTIIPYFNCGNCNACRTGKSNCCTQLQVFGVHIDGGMSEYISVPSSALVHAEALDYDQLALVEPLAIGAHGIRRAAVLEGEFVLVIGAGPIGLGAMEFARLAGAEVIAMDIDRSRLQFCADRLNIPYTILAADDHITQNLLEITLGEMPTVVIDATGSRQAINNGFRYVAHGGRYILIGLQKEDISFSHPEFHKRELTLMSSRNATKQDFDFVMDSIKKGVDPSLFITHRVKFDEAASAFETWLSPGSGVIKAMIEF